MCNCLAEKAEGFKKAHPEIEEVRFLEVEGFSGQLYTRIEVKEKNTIPHKGLHMYLTYCPFCGQPYNKEERFD